MCIAGTLAFMGLLSRVVLPLRRWNEDDLAVIALAFLEHGCVFGILPKSHILALIILKHFVITLRHLLLVHRHVTLFGNVCPADFYGLERWLRFVHHRRIILNRIREIAVAELVQNCRVELLAGLLHLAEHGAVLIIEIHRFKNRPTAIALGSAERRELVPRGFQFIFG